MILDIVYLIIGLALILFGANWLTDGSAAIARRFGISDLIVGLTVVAFGTSAPELVISVMSAINGSAGLAIGNVVGSNLFNILVIIGVTAIIRPLRRPLSDDQRTPTRAPLIPGTPRHGQLRHTRRDIHIRAHTRRRNTAPAILRHLHALHIRTSQINPTATGRPAADAAAQKPQIPMAKASLLVIAGLAGLIAGGDRFVAGASGIAAALGVSDALIGLTIVAMGTSLPELAASIVAAIKGRPGLAIGNVIDHAYSTHSSSSAQQPSSAHCHSDPSATSTSSHSAAPHSSSGSSHASTASAQSPGPKAYSWPPST